WPTVTDPGDEIARMLNTVPKYLASTTVREGSWSETTVIDEVRGQVGELKREPGKDIFLLGSSGLAQSLIGNGLIDEYRLMIHPAVLGAGKRLFRNGGRAAALRLVDAVTTTSGLVTLTYEPAAGA